MKQAAMVLIITAIIGFIFADMAMAGRIGRRQVRQHGRIRQGVNTGELTYRETRMLMGAQRRIKKAKTRAFHDGELTLNERLRIEKNLDIASRHIYRLKHNHHKR